MTQKHKNKANIGLSDLMIALADLPWRTEAHQEEIFHALGFSWQNIKPEPIESVSPRQVFDRNRYQHRPNIRPTSKNLPGFTAPPSPLEPVGLPKHILTSQLKPLEVVQDDAPAWLNQENEMITSEEPIVQLARANLFPDITCRGILTAALSIKKQGKDVDIPRLIKQVTKGQIPKIVPRLAGMTLERGCQLLLDYSDSMVPFWEDLTSLADQVQNVLGKERVKIYEFAQDPATGQCWDSANVSTNWEPDLTRPILLATDLGINGGRMHWPINAVWRRFIDQCAQKHIPLIVLVPWRANYWPDIHSHHPIVIHWNPHTTATMIKKLVGTGHQIPQ